MPGRFGPLLAMLLAACSQLPAPAPPAAPAAQSSPGGASPGAPAGADPVPADPEPAQTLYRVRYDGPEGEGSLRLVLRQVAAERFQLKAADTFGRAVWSLDLDGDRTLMIDHRGEQACVAGGELRVPEVALAPLPLPAVARVLDGRPPLVPPPGADPADWTDGSGRRWTTRLEAEELTAWTMWEEGEPRLWWGRQPRGGILSHRDGSQFRWRRTAREALAPESYEPLQPPESYELGTCRTGDES